MTSDVNDPERGDQQRDDGKQSDFKEQRQSNGQPQRTSRNRTAKSGPLKRSAQRISRIVRARRTHHSMLANITQ